MDFIRITPDNGARFDTTWRLYEESFPIAERRKLHDHARACEDTRFFPISVWDDDEFVGFVFYWEWDNYRYVEHLAVNPEIRGEGYGSQILKYIRKDAHTIILEIDPLCNELSVRRLQFYERAGFTLTPFRFVHLPYRLEADAQELLILSYPDMITRAQHQDFLDFLNDVVKSYCEQKSS